MAIKKIILIIVGLAVIAGLAFVFFKSNTVPGATITINKPIEVPAKPVAKPVNNSPEFGKPITLTLDKKNIFSDGLLVILTNIDDSLCSQNVQCVWAGEISAVLEISGGKIKYPGEVHLSTVTNKSTTVEGYTITLEDGDAKSATVLVTYKAP